MDHHPSILSHVSVGTNDFKRAIAFYDAVLPTLGCKRLMEYPEAIRASHRQANAYGKQYPEFWVQTPFNGQTATADNGTHIGFIALSQEAGISGTDQQVTIRLHRDPVTRTAPIPTTFSDWDGRSAMPSASKSAFRNGRRLTRSTPPFVTGSRPPKRWRTLDDSTDEDHVAIQTL